MTMTTATPTQRDATPEQLAALRARLLAGAARPGTKPPTARLCPTVRRLLEGRRGGGQPGA
jgi:hypothetical protein